MAGTDFSHLTSEELIKGIQALNIPDYIRSKAYGIDVRETLAQMTEMLMQLAYNQGMDPQQAKDWVSQLNNKITKGQVTMSDLSQEIKEALTGGAVPVVGVDAVGTSNIIDGAVTADKTAFIESGKQLINPNEILKGQAWTTTGWVTNANYDTTGGVPIVDGQTHFTVNGHPIGTIYYYFNAQDTPIESGSLSTANISEIAIPTNASYIRLIYPNATNPKIILARGQHAELEYEDFYYKLKNDQNDSRITKVENDISIINEGSIESKRDQFKPKIYNAVVKNSVNANRAQSPVKLAINFEFGEVKNPSRIVVESGGIELTHQWEADRFANPKFDESIGYHADGSLKNGYLHVLDDFSPYETKEYVIKVYPQAIIDNSDYFNVSETSDKIVVSSANINFELNGVSNYLPSEIKIGDKTRKLALRPALRYNGTTVIFSEPRNDTTLDFKYEYGSIYFEAITTANFRNEFEFKISTRVYKTGYVEVKQHVDVLKTFDTSLVNQILLRAYVGNFEVTSASNVVAYEFTEGSRKYAYGIVQAGGDAPRGAGTASPNLPAYSNQVLVDTNTLELLVGWNQPTAGIIVPVESQFMTTFFFDFKGYAFEFDGEIARVFNPLKAQATTDAKLVSKDELAKNLKIYALHMLEDIETNPTSSPFNPPIAGRLLKYVLTGQGDVEALATQYIDQLTDLYGELTSENLWAKRQDGGMSLDVAGRLFPIAYKFYELLNGDVRFKNIITAYADMLASSVETSGWTGILLNALNSNGCATGLRGLSLGLKVDPDNTRYQQALATNTNAFKDFVRAENILVDGHQNLSTNHYLAYHLYSMYEYEQSDADIQLDVAAYVDTATNSATELLELEYCVSSARRGLALSYVYSIYLLTKRANYSDLAKANLMMAKLVKDLNPSGGAPRILDGWYNPTSSYYNNVAILSEVLLQLYNLLMEAL